MTWICSRVNYSYSNAFTFITLVPCILNVAFNMIRCIYRLILTFIITFISIIITYRLIWCILISLIIIVFTLRRLFYLFLLCLISNCTVCLVCIPSAATTFWSVCLLVSTYSVFTPASASAACAFPVGANKTTEPEANAITAAAVHLFFILPKLVALFCRALTPISF